MLFSGTADQLAARWGIPVAKIKSALQDLGLPTRGTFQLTRVQFDQVRTTATGRTFDERLAQWIDKQQSDPTTAKTSAQD